MMTVCAEQHVNFIHSDAASLLNDIEQRLDQLYRLKANVT